MLFLIGLSIPFFALLMLLAFLPQWAPQQWDRHHGICILTLVMITVGATYLFHPEHLKHFFHAFKAEYLPFVLCLGCLYILSCGIKVHVNAPPSPRWNLICLVLGMVTATLLGTTGACVIWTHTMLHLNAGRRYKIHTFVFLIFCVANVGGMFSSLGDPPLLLGFLKGLPFFWPMKHLTAGGLYTVVLLLAVYYGIDLHYYRKERLEAPENKCSITVDGVGYAIAIALFMASIVCIQKYATATWIVCGTCLHSTEIYKLGLLGTTLCISLRQARKMTRFSSHVLQELSWTFLGLFLCVVPVVQLLHHPAMYPVLKRCIQANATWLFWLSGIFSSFLDNAPTYVLFVELAGGFENIALASLKHIAYGTVAMGAMTYIGNAPNLLVKNISERAGVPMPSYLGYIKWSMLVLLPILLTLVHLTSLLA